MQYNKIQPAINGKTFIGSVTFNWPGLYFIIELIFSLLIKFHYDDERKNIFTIRWKFSFAVIQFRNIKTIFFNYEDMCKNVT